MRSRLLAAAALVALTFTLTAARATAQMHYHLDGVVVNQDGTPVPGARIDLGTMQSVTTDSTGSFHYTTTISGPYQATVTTKFGRTIATIVAGSFNTIKVADFAGKAHRTSSRSTVALNDLEASGKAKSAYDKATAAMSRSDFNQARKFVNQAIEASPRWARPYALRGMLELVRQDYTPARADLQTAITDNPGDWRSRTELAKLYTATGDYAASRQQLQQALQLPPPHWQTYAEMVRLDLMQRNYKEAATMAASALACKPPAPPSIHFLAGEAEFNQGQYQSAAQEFSAFLAQAPHSPAFANARAAAQRALTTARRHLPR
ncbi:MAG: tetratricopeptide repeat protein [Terriglobales bacterium]